MQDSINLKRFRINFFIDDDQFEKITDGQELVDIPGTQIEDNVARDLVDGGASSLFLNDKWGDDSWDFSIKDVTVFGIELVEGFDPTLTPEENRAMIRDELEFVSKYASDNRNVRETAAHLLEVFDGLNTEKLWNGKQSLCDVTPDDLEGCPFIQYQPLHSIAWERTRFLAEGDEISFTVPVTNRNSPAHHYTGDNNGRLSWVQAQGVIMPPRNVVSDPAELKEPVLLITHSSHKDLYPTGTVVAIEDMQEWDVQRKVWADEKLRAKKVFRGLDQNDKFEQSASKAKPKTKSKAKTKSAGETLGH